MGLAARFPDEQDDGDPLSEAPIDAAANRRVALYEALFTVVRQRAEADGPMKAGLSTLEWLNPQVVADEAGTDTSVFERLWGSPDAEGIADLSPFERFLVECFGEHRGPAVYPESARALELHSDDLDQLIRTGLSNAILTGDYWIEFLISLAFSSRSMHTRDDYINFISELEHVYEIGLYLVGRRVRQPLTIRDLAIGVAHILEGPWFQRISGNADPNPIVRYTSPHSNQVDDWHIDGIATLGFITTVTEPL